MSVVKSAPVIACILVLLAGCALDMGGLSADVPTDAGASTTIGDEASIAPEAAPPAASNDGGDAAALASDSATPDVASAPETGPPPPPKGPGQGQQGDDDGGPGKGK